MDFRVSYSAKRFDNIICAGVITVDSDSIESAKEGSFEIVFNKLKEDNDEYSEGLDSNIQSLCIEVSGPLDEEILTGSIEIK